MQGMSERQYARHAGLSRGGVTRAKESGRLVLHPDGSIDAEASDRRRRANTAPKIKAAPAASAPPDPPRPRTAAGPTPSSLSGDFGEMPSLGSGEPNQYLKARTLNEVLKAQDRRLTVEERRGRLVERAKVERLVFRLAREERDAWVNWPARVAALMAAEIAAEVERATGAPCAIDPGVVQAVLERHVRAQLEGLAELRFAVD